VPSGTGTSQPSILRGIPLNEEPGLGALTMPGFLREVTERHAGREALVLHEAGGTTRWSYAELWERSVEVAKALLACGMGKGSRVGVMMTNRPEWISAAFGATLAGGIAVTISTFSTPSELEHLLGSSGVSVLLFERQVLKKDFAAILGDLIPEIGSAPPGEVESLAYPFLRHVACVGEGGGAIEDWATFLARGSEIPEALVDATAATVKPSDPGVLFFSSGSTSKPKGILSAHRGVSIQLWRWGRVFGLGDDVRCWSANGFFWSGNFGMAIGGTLSRGGSLVLQPTFVADEALRLMEAEKVTFPTAWPHQWKQLEDSPAWGEVDLSSLRYVDPSTPLGKHPTVSTSWSEPMAAYGNTETFTINAIFASDVPAERVGKSHGEALPGNLIKIVDPLTGQIVPIGERGEIAVKGPTLMLGYIGTPADETLDDEGYFRTGDGGYADTEGRLFWEGRLNDIIKTGGANVSPLEIDECLAAFPGVKRSQTVGVPHETLGEIVVACIIPFEGELLDEAAIRDFTKEKLASYKVPRRVLFFTEQDLAQTGSAKIKTADLRKLAAAKLDAA
jgi:fatty-acyl-CoA synthase